MTRYNFNPEVTHTFDPFRDERTVKIRSVMQENPEGEWVAWTDVEKLRAFLEAQIPEKRIARLERALGLVSTGKCPECERDVRNWEAPSGSFAPEAYATLREEGIDPTTGHRQGCTLSKP